MSPPQPPVALTSPPNGPVVLTRRLPFWLSWYQRCPTLGSMRANIPSPPFRSCHIAGPGLPAESVVSKSSCPRVTEESVPSLNSSPWCKRRR